MLSTHWAVHIIFIQFWINDRCSTHLLHSQFHNLGTDIETFCSVFHGPVVKSMTALPKSLCLERLLLLFYPFCSAVWLRAPTCPEELVPFHSPCWCLTHTCKDIPTDLTTLHIRAPFGIQLWSQVTIPFPRQQGTGNAIILHFQTTVTRWTGWVLSLGNTSSQSVQLPISSHRQAARGNTTNLMFVFL